MLRVKRYWMEHDSTDEYVYNESEGWILRLVSNDIPDDKVVSVSMKKSIIDRNTVDGEPSLHLMVTCDVIYKTDEI